MNEEVEFELTEEDEKRLEALSCDELALIDGWLLKHATHQWQKTAMVVVDAIGESDRAEKLEDVSDLIFGLRVEHLVSQGSLIAQGNVRRMRSSEIKLGEK